MAYCFNCKKECKPQQWQIRVVNESGNYTYEQVCSTNCGDIVSDKYLKIHQGRVDDMTSKNYQRLK